MLNTLTPENAAAKNYNEKKFIILSRFLFSVYECK